MVLTPHALHCRGDKVAHLEVGDTVCDENAAMEPKKKGRFLVMEQVCGVEVWVFVGAHCYGWVSTRR